LALILTVTESTTGGLLVSKPQSGNRVVRTVVSCYNDGTTPLTISADTCTGLPTGVTKTYSSSVGKEIAAGATEFLVLELTIASTASAVTTAITYQVTAGSNYTKTFDLVVVADNLNRQRESFSGAVAGSKAVFMDEFVTLGQLLSGAGYNMELYVNKNGDLELSAIVPAAKTTKYSTTIGDGVTTTFVITHNLGSQSVSVNFYSTSAPYAMLFTDWKHTSVTTITVTFVDPPASNAVTVVVQS